MKKLICPTEQEKERLQKFEQLELAARKVWQETRHVLEAEMRDITIKHGADTSKTWTTIQPFELVDGYIVCNT